MTAARSDFLVEEYDPMLAPTADPRLDALASDDAWSDYPWADRDAAATAQRLQTATWIEEILADIDDRR